MYLTSPDNIQDVGNNIKNMDKSKLEQYAEQLADWFVDKAFDLFVTVVFLLIGFRICKFIVKLIKKSFVKSALEPSVAGFLLSLIKGVLYAIVFIMAISILGFQVTSLVTILGTASLAIGLALQGSLSNFAGGVLILLMKPFKVGDYIIENGGKCEGIVESIDIFYTKLKTVDNKTIVIPNGNIMANSLINVTSEEVRRLDIIIGVAYDSDIGKVKTVLNEIVDDSPYYDRSRKKDVFVDELSTSAIMMGIRCFVKTEDYWVARWEITEKIKLKFDENNIVIPFNQLEIKVNSNQNAV